MSEGMATSRAARNVEREGLDSMPPRGRAPGLRRVMRRQRPGGVVILDDAVGKGLGGLML